jgi:ankyrin repeat protein/catechol 2,3-dioxygenase-like lactoylglutathione lyase family enzyme
MPKALPAQPHIDWLKKTAKQQLDELRTRDPAAKLHQAQLAVARDYGFPSWRALKAHVDAQSIDGRIIAAAKDGRADELDALLARHPDKLVITGSQWNRPLLHIAAGEGHLACVNVLLRRGFDIATRDRLDNATALHWAAQYGTVDVVTRLVEAGADIDGEGDAHEIGVIGWATCFRNVRREAADYLLSRGAKPTIFSAVALNRADLVRALVQQDGKLLRAAKMSRFEHYRTPLHFAVLKNRPEMVKLLLELGAEATGKDGRGYTPLSLVTPKSNQTIAAMLIAAGASPNERHTNRFELAVPILSVTDMRASLDYYVDKLGFKKKWEWGDPPDFACVARDEVELFLSLGTQRVAAGSWISIFVQDVDALYEDYKQRGAIIREPPTEYPWGMREMNVEDLDGHRFRLGTDGGTENRTYNYEKENEAV